MFEPTSRYFNIPTASLATTDADGRSRAIAYKRRRFIPPTEGSATLLEHAMAEHERLDHVAARYLGDPTQFWRICDANGVLVPDELEQTGRVVRIALAGF